MGRISNAEYQRRQDNRNAGLGFLLLVTYWPAMSLWFPRMLGMIA
mgnify:CR=1 FL=1